MFRSELLGVGFRLRRLIGFSVIRIFDLLEPHRKSPQRFGRVAAHQRDIGGGIYAAREKHAERHIRHHALFDGRIEPLQDSMLAEFDAVALAHALECALGNAAAR